MSNTQSTTSAKDTNGGNAKAPAAKKTPKVKGPNDPTMIAFSLTPEEIKTVDQIAAALGGPGVHISRVVAARAAIIRFALTAEFKALVTKNVTA